MSCDAVKNGIVKSKGHACLEYHEDGKPVYSCLGIVDRMTDESIDECKECKKFVRRLEACEVEEC